MQPNRRRGEKLKTKRKNRGNISALSRGRLSREVELKFNLEL